MVAVSRYGDADLKWAVYDHNLIRPTNGRILSREDTDNFQYLEDREDSHSFQGSDTMSKIARRRANCAVNLMIPLRVSILLYIDVLLQYKLQ